MLKATARLALFVAWALLTSCVADRAEFEEGRRLYWAVHDSYDRDARASEWEKHPLDKQYEIFRYAMLIVHPPNSELSKVLAKRGKAALYHMLQRMDEVAVDWDYWTSLEVYEDMKRGNHYPVCEDALAMWKITANKDRIRDAEIRAVYQRDIQRLCPQRESVERSEDSGPITDDILVMRTFAEAIFLDPRSLALAEAAGRGRAAVIDRLVAAGADVDAFGKLNATPLMWALIRRNLRGFKRLLELGADSNLVMDNGRALMHWAVEVPDHRFLRLALQHGGDPDLVAGGREETPLFQAVGPWTKNKLPILLNGGADMDFQNADGMTPVMRAAVSGHYDVVHRLLERGAEYRAASSLPGEPGLADFIADAMRWPYSREPEQAQWLKRVTAWLAQRGVEIPERGVSVTSCGPVLQDGFWACVEG